MAIIEEVTRQLEEALNSDKEIILIDRSVMIGRFGIIEDIFVVICQKNYILNQEENIVQYHES